MTLGGSPLTAMRVTHLDLSEPATAWTQHLAWKMTSAARNSSTPLFYKAIVAASGPDATFFVMDGWGHGVVFVNGVNLGELVCHSGFYTVFYSAQHSVPLSAQHSVPLSVPLRSRKRRSLVCATLFAQTLTLHSLTAHVGQQHQQRQALPHLTRMVQLHQRANSVLAS